MSNSKAMQAADRWFSKYIRLRKADDDGYVSCFTCGCTVHWKDAHNGHFMGRGHMNTRYDSTNCQVQCFDCNVAKQGNLKVFAENLDKEYGKGTANRLLVKAKQHCKMTLRDFQMVVKNAKAYLVFLDKNL